MNRLKELRLSKKMTQQECADLLGISRRTVQNLERGDADVLSEKFQYYVKTLEGPKSDGFSTNVLLGDDLKRLTDLARGFRKRDCYARLSEYLRVGPSGKVCVLYGLRRTGKTTLIYQALDEVGTSHSAYVKAREGNTMAGLIADIDILRSRGIRYLFIDEVTLISDFINTAGTLSDVYAALGMRIVLSGTDSLGFALSSADELYDRTLTIHTSYIPFGEWSGLLGIDDIDLYIEYGGTLKAENMRFDDPDRDRDEVAFRDEESTRKYIDTAIVRNIQRSLENDRFGSRFAHLRALYENDELTNAINRIIEDMNHEFLRNVITRPFRSHDLGSSRQILTHSREPELRQALGNVDEEEILSKLKGILDVKEKDEQRMEVTDEAMKQIKRYLFELDLIKEVNVFYGDGSKGKRVVFTQPGMRYAITKALVYSLMQDGGFRSLRERDRVAITQTILGDVKGRMLEDIVLLETSLSQRAKTVFKFVDYVKGEFDMVVYDPKSGNTEAYEVKHSKALSFEAQTRHLRNPELGRVLEDSFGPISLRCVLYRGEDQSVDGIKYGNVEKYLKNR